MAQVAGEFADSWERPSGFRAVCSCGWEGERRSAESSASGDRDDHLRVAAVGPPDALDVVVNELLNMTDDLVEAAGWLADHWPAELPAPTWHGNGTQGSDRHPAITLLSCCALEQMPRAAELLDATPVDKTHSNGSRWRCVSRDFGMVRVEVAAGLSRGGER